MAIQVDIVTPLKNVFSGEAAEVILPAWNGEMGVLEGHDILLSLLRGGITRVKTSAGVQRFVTGRGFVECGPHRVTLLTDACTPADEVDKAQAQATMDGAIVVLTEHPWGSIEHSQALEKYELANAALQA